MHRLNPSMGNCEGLMAGNREGDNFWVETEDNADVVRFQTNENFFCAFHSNVYVED